ncbi:hypothetical protein SK224_05505 [Microbacterium sp. BG28]|uniref:VG15 protein n=1 Tax=Microbacterium sp. BG28 TaxID=3097356 RepID=UPI002A5AFE80|nr:hypothetical protein [Microbacterium sp. BG28]MDY0828580.1 hypothetical protein [Microbacterium sp. BG28]
MTLPKASARHYNSQRRIAGNALIQARRLWQRIGTEFDAGWALIGAEMTALVTDAMREAAAGGIEYLPEVLEETGQTAALATVSASAFAGWTREGLPVGEALHGAVRVAKQAVSAGMAPEAALLAGRKSLTRVIPSAIADADRGAVHAGLTSVGYGYVRMLNLPSCKRCIILAGRWYAWNEGFQRHPLCDCRHIPAAEDRKGDWRTDPYALFKRMSVAEQDRIFGAESAQAIRDGADMYRVVNIQRRGLPTVNAFRPPRMTLDEIYAKAGANREKAVALLTEQGYILPGGQLREGAIGYGDLGLDSQGAHLFGAGELGRGGTRIGATYAHRQAAASGVRDPLNRYTQTAAERSLNDAVLAARALAEGRNPFGRWRITQAVRDRVADDLATQINALRAGQASAQVRRLADLLGVNYR